jgi:hypothetical protein
LNQFNKTHVCTPSLTGVLRWRSLGTTLSACSKSGINDFAASSGFFSYALKPGVVYKRSQIMMIHMNMNKDINIIFFVYNGADDRTQISNILFISLTTSGGVRKKNLGGPLKIVIYKLNTKIILHKNI